MLCNFGWCYLAVSSTWSLTFWLYPLHIPLTVFTSDVIYYPHCYFFLFLSLTCTGNCLSMLLGLWYVGTLWDLKTLCGSFDSPFVCGSLTGSFLVLFTPCPLLVLSVSSCFSSWGLEHPMFITTRGRTFLVWLISLFLSSCFDIRVSALLNSVLTTDLLCSSGWMLSQSICWSVWVGFQ